MQGTMLTTSEKTKLSRNQTKCTMVFKKDYTILKDFSCGGGETLKLLSLCRGSFSFRFHLIPDSLPVRFTLRISLRIRKEFIAITP